MITYEQLLKKIESMTNEQRKLPVIIYDDNDDESYYGEYDSSAFGLNPALVFYKYPDED